VDPDLIAAAAQSERRRSWWLSNAAANDSSDAEVWSSSHSLRFLQETAR